METLPALLTYCMGYAQVMTTGLPSQQANKMERCDFFVVNLNGLFNEKWRFGDLGHINSLWPDYAIWRHRFESTLVEVMACSLTAPSHYLNDQWWFIKCVLWYGNCIRNELNSLRTRQNGHHFADDIFKGIFLDEKVRISIEISLKFVP